MSAAPEFDVFHCPLDGIRLIEASAGTGKTWNICGLYLRLLLERELTVEALLVVTFTKAATAELSSRIRARIGEMLQVLEGAAPSPDPFVTDLITATRARGIDHEHMRRRLQLAMEELPDDQREVVLLRLEQELSLDEIGEITGVGRETVKSRLRYAMDKLRARLRP